MTNLVATESGLLIPRGSSIQPISDDFYTDGLLDEFARVDHQHPLSPSLRAAIFGSETSSKPNKNLLDNGAMNVWQRAVNPAAYVASTFNADRWNHGLTTLGTFTSAVAIDAPANTEFTKCTKLTCTVANAAPAAGSISEFQQALEGIHLQHLLWGFPTAKPVTASFWVKSNTVGNYVCELVRNEAGGRFISATYSINIANTWEYKTITFQGDINSTTTNAADQRLTLLFWLGAGSTYGGGANLGTAWHTTANLRAVGCTNLSATANNSIQFTGVQLEVGSKASPFEYRRFDEDLRRCQRYLWKSFPWFIGIGQALDNTAGSVLLTGICQVINQPAIYYHKFANPMRAAPVIVSYNPTQANANFRSSNGVADYPIYAGPLASDLGFYIAANTMAVGTWGAIHISCNAEI